MNFRSSLCVSFLAAPLMAACAAQSVSPTLPSALRSATSVEMAGTGVLPTSRPLLFITNNDAAVRAFDATSKGNVAPERIIAGSATGLTNPTGIAVAPDHRLGVANVDNQGGAVHAEIFAPNARGNAAPIKAISCGGTTVPLGTAFDGAGNLYVTSGDDGDNIAVFPPSANGCVTSNRIIGGPYTGLHQPFGIALDPSGAIYVANASGASVAVFAPGATGDAHPRALIAGGNSRVSVPSGVALDATHNLYVTEFRANKILEFAPGANGNISPTRIIAGPHTGLNGPNGVAVDRAGNIYVANTFANSVTVYAPNVRGDATPLRKLAGPNTGLSAPSQLAISQ